MNRNAFCSVLTAFCLLVLTGCSSGGPHANSDVTPVESITATNGTPQSHAINATFGVPLAATVMTNGSPTSGMVVTFTAPATGASGTFADTHTNTTTATTNTSGVATSAAFTADGTAGAYTVTAVVSGVPTPASFSLTNTTGAPAAIVATSGTPQSAVINVAFATLLVATVMDSGQNPVSGAVVTFTAPVTGAGGTFAGASLNTITVTTNASGVATAAFTANGISGSETVTAAAAGLSTPANFVLTNLAGPPATITATSGTPQTAAIDTAFAPLVATVLDVDSNPVSGVQVTFTGPATGLASAAGTFANGTATETDTTNASGVATSTTFSANGTTGGPYTVTATVAGLSTPANFSLTNRVAANTYVFYLSGQEVFGPDFYALAGSIEIDMSGDVIAGEQDYNDAEGFTSPEPSGDTITGGKLTLDTSGQGTLTLITNNTNLGIGGTETLGVQFVNAKHALVVQFDGSATSSGSMDLQTPPSALSGGYAFTLEGVDDFYSPVAYGGVFSISGGTTLENGLIDSNDDGQLTTAAPLTGTLSNPDSFGRGTITSTINYFGIPVALNYYIVGLEAIRIIDVDTTDSAVGSAFGQGINATASSNASLGTSVFEVQGSPYPINYASLGMFSTSNTSASVANFSGVADDNEFSYGIQLPATPISGTYSVASTGYGSLTIAAGDLGDVSAFGLYMTDPNLNLSDPNNTTGGLGGALLADMDGILPGGTGIVVPQTDTSTASFTGHYAFGAQGFNAFCCEFDLVGMGLVTGGVFNGTGLLGDPFLTFGANVTNSDVKFSGTPLADASNIGRYTMFSTNPTPNPLTVTISGVPTDLDVVLYQASGGQVFWLDEDFEPVFIGSLQQQQGSLTGIPSVRKGGTQTEAKPKP